MRPCPDATLCSNYRAQTFQRIWHARAPHAICAHARARTERVEHVTRETRTCIYRLLFVCSSDVHLRQPSFRAKRQVYGKAERAAQGASRRAGARRSSSSAEGKFQAQQQSSAACPQMPSRTRAMRRRADDVPPRRPRRVTRRGARTRRSRWQCAALPRLAFFAVIRRGSRPEPASAAAETQSLETDQQTSAR
jgi:hypothetical protein